MSTIQEVPYTTAYPLLFEVTDGPSFQRIADAAKYYHDPDVNMPLRFSGVLTDIRTGRKRNVKLVGDAWGFWSGTNYSEGDMVVMISFRGYTMRFGGHWHYNWRNRNRKNERPLELSRIEKPGKASE